MPNDTESQLQQNYYASTASAYDDLHTSRRDEHYLALEFLSGCISYFDVESVLDVGSGTGRALLHLSDRHPGLRAVGIEPVRELREAAYAKGLTPDRVVEGDGTRLPFADESFDVACAFGVMHHIKHPETAVAEMLRVSKVGVFISDSNNFGQGRPAVRAVKQALNRAGLWKLANFVQTRGKGYAISEGDGLYYSYSLFTNLDQIRKKFPKVHMLNTSDAGSDLYRTASHVALMAVRG